MCYLQEEDTSILVIDDSRDTNTIQDEQEQLQASLNDHGHLVQQILDSQKEYSQMSGKTEIVSVVFCTLITYILKNNICY